MTLPFLVWTHDGATPEVLTRVESLAAGRLAWTNSRHAAISSGGTLLDVRGSTGDDKARAMERAAEAAWRAERGGAEPRAVPPPAAPPARPSRPAATRPPLLRRRVAPPPAPPASAPPAVEEPTELQLARARAAEAESKVASLQQLLGRVSAERDVFRERIEALADQRTAQIRGEVESLTTDLAVARRDASTALVRAIDAERERDAARAALAARPAAPPVDELQLARVATRAAREAVRVTREDARLRAIAERVGGVDALERRLAGAEQLLRRLA